MITVLSGKNAYALKAALDEIVAAAHADVGDMGIERIDAAEADVDTILQSAQSLPFLVPKKLVIVLNVQGSAALLERIDDVIERTADSVDVVLVGPVFDKRTAGWKLLKKHATVQEFAELKPFELPRWVAQTAADMGLAISSGDAAYLVDRVGANQMILRRELEKMKLQSSTITRELIDMHTDQTPQSSVFDMLEAAFSGRQQRAIQLYRDQRKQRVDPHYIVAMLSWQLHNLALAVHASPATESTLVAAGQSPYSARKSLGLARSIDKGHIRSYITGLTQLDRHIKTVAEPDAALELYLIGLAT